MSKSLALLLAGDVEVNPGPRDNTSSPEGDKFDGLQSAIQKLVEKNENSQRETSVNLDLFVLVSMS